MSCQWKSIGQRRLPRDWLRIGVTNNASVMLPTKKGRKLQPSKTVPDK
jgi:hypothetical protein